MIIGILPLVLPSIMLTRNASNLVVLLIAHPGSHQSYSHPSRCCRRRRFHTDRVDVGRPRHLANDP
jgi:hypothetical protein